MGVRSGEIADLPTAALILAGTGITARESGTPVTGGYRSDGGDLLLARTQLEGGFVWQQASRGVMEQQSNTSPCKSLPKKQRTG